MALTHSLASSPSLAFFEGGGEMGQRIRAHDWTSTSLGAPGTWPAPLRTVVRILLSTNHPVFVFWGAELICFYNDAYRRSLGPEKHPSILGVRGREAWDEIWPIIGPQIDQVMTGGGATWHENHLVPIVRHGRLEQVYWTYSYGPIDDALAPQGIGGVLVLCTETTAQVLAEQRSHAAARRKDEFLATLSHELRNPLAPIRNAALILRTATSDAPSREWAALVIDRQVHSMARLLDDLLDISRITRGALALSRQRVSLASVVEAAMEVARPVIDARRHVLRTELPTGSIELDADPLRLSQALANLLTNAAKYTDPGGEIVLCARIAGESLSISLTDSGVGLAHDSLVHIFGMFSQVRSTLDRSEGGLGIGLALVKGIVELHGGRVEATSQGLGKGSEFRIWLPMRASSAKTAS